MKDVINWGGGGFAKRRSHLISLFSKSDDEEGRGVKNLKKMMTSFMNGPLYVFSKLLLNKMDFSQNVSRANILIYQRSKRTSSQSTFTFYFW